MKGIAGMNGIPVVDIGAYLAEEPGGLERAAGQLRHAAENIGFFHLIGHGVPQELIDRVFEAAARFHALPLEEKLALRQDRNNVGYMPVRSSVARVNALDGSPKKANVVAAFFAKRDLAPDHPDVLAGKRFRGLNQWPPNLPGFRETCNEYAATLEALGRKMLPVYATALDLPPDYFEAAFREPAYSLRLSHYPAVDDYEEDEYGIAPHTDGGFMTFLAQNEVPGLAVRRTDGAWIDAEVVPGAFVVNAGDLQRRLTNDRFLSTPHRAVNRSGGDRYAIPFFFNFDLDHVIECAPSCTGPGNPTRYEPITYGDHLANFTRQNYDDVRAAHAAAE